MSFRQRQLFLGIQVNERHIKAFNFHIKKICAVDIDLNATMPNYDIEIVAFAVISDAKMGHTRGHNNAQLECVILM